MIIIEVPLICTLIFKFEIPNIKYKYIFTETITPLVIYLNSLIGIFLQITKHWQFGIMCIDFFFKIEFQMNWLNRKILYKNFDNDFRTHQNEITYLKGFS